MWSGDNVDVSALRAMQREAGELARALAAGAAAAEADFVGGDDAGVIEVAIGASGAPTRVRLARDWEQIVGSAGLEPAVMAALSAVAMQRLTAWADGVARGCRPSESTQSDP